MSADATSPWVGASGVAYTYFIFDLDFVVPPRAGIYIYARKNDETIWVPVYMGQGNLASRCTDEPLLAAIRDKGATHVHLRLVTLEEDRADELRDLLAKYKNAFPPGGCQPETDRPPPAPDAPA